MLKKQKKRYQRHKRVRAKVYGTAEKPRLCVFRSAKYIYAQLINDERGKVIASLNKEEIKKTTKHSLKQKSAVKEGQLAGKIAQAHEAGKLIAEKAKNLKTEKVVFDRGGYQYHGRVKALADGAREGGLKF